MSLELGAGDCHRAQGARGPHGCQEGFDLYSKKKWKVFEESRIEDWQDQSCILNLPHSLCYGERIDKTEASCGVTRWPPAVTQPGVLVGM